MVLRMIRRFVNFRDVYVCIIYQKWIENSIFHGPTNLLSNLIISGARKGIFIIPYNELFTIIIFFDIYRVIDIVFHCHIIHHIIYIIHILYKIKLENNDVKNNVNYSILEINLNFVKKKYKMMKNSIQDFWIRNKVRFTISISKVNPNDFPTVPFSNVNIVLLYEDCLNIVYKSVIYFEFIIFFMVIMFINSIHCEAKTRCLYDILMYNPIIEL